MTAMTTGSRSAQNQPIPQNQYRNPNQGSRSQSAQPTGEGVIGVEASGMAVITFHIPYRDTDPADAAAMLSRFASHALHWHKKIKSHIAASAYRQSPALEEASHTRV